MKDITYITVTEDPIDPIDVPITADEGMTLASEITDIAASIYEPIIIGLRLEVAELRKELAALRRIQ